MMQNRPRERAVMKRARRAAAACYTCHKRKVRCDALIHGLPCTNCRIDGRDDCTLRAKVSERDKLQKPAHINHPDNNSEHQAIQQIGSDDTDEDHRYPVAFNDSVSAKTLDGNVIFSSHRFLDCHGLSSLPSEDIEYLISKRSLHVPNKDLLDEYVTRYFAMVHPFVPLIDEAEFWRIYRGTASTGKISLFVFQAILFSACPFVSSETLQKCGFPDKRAARTELHRRAKLLFDLKGEDRYLSRAQGAVLLSHHTSTDDPHAGSLWVANSIRIAMALNSTPLAPGCEDVHQPHVKRLWWSILLRDRSLSIGLRRHPQVTSVDFMTDKDWLLDESDFENEFKTSEVYSETVKRQLFSALQEQCRLAVLLTDAISILFTAPGPTAQSHAFENMRAHIATLNDVKENLLVWKEQSNFTPLRKHDAGTHYIVNMFTHITYMYYYTALISIAHYEALYIENKEPPHTSEDIYYNRVLRVGRDLRIAIEGLMQTMEYFQENQCSMALPLSVLAYAGIPMVLSAIDLKLSQSDSEMLNRRTRLETFARIIQMSRNIYEVTDVVADGTNQILQLAYAITKKLFLRKQLLPSHMDRETALNHKTLELQRPRSWNDAYLRYPRAYLYITTTVEYSLSCGRLPTESIFPGQVRHVPSIIFGSQIPRAIDASVSIWSKPDEFDAEKDFRLEDDPQALSLEPVRKRREAITVVDNTSKRHSTNSHPSSSNNDLLPYCDSFHGNVPFFNINKLNNHVSTREIEDMNSAQDSSVNLDYFDIQPIETAPVFNDDTSTPSSDEVQTYAAQTYQDHSPPRISMQVVGNNTSYDSLFQLLQEDLTYRPAPIQLEYNNELKNGHRVIT